MKGAMRFLTFVSATTLYSVVALADSITISAHVPGSGTPAGRHNPSCGGDVTSGEEIIQFLRTTAHLAGYGQIAETVANGSSARNRLQAMLGIHNGPSVCRVFCASLPNVPRGYDMCVDGRCRHVGHASSQSAVVDFDAWALLQVWANAPVGSSRVVCFLAKNWKHDQSRAFSVRIHY
jgi:hypothetical protein